VCVKAPSLLNVSVIAWRLHLMRAPLLFALLFIGLMLVYRALVDLIGATITYAVQTAMVIGLLMALTWWRRRKR
jgi:hypothetical protein